MAISVVLRVRVSLLVLMLPRRQRVGDGLHGGGQCRRRRRHGTHHRRREDVATETNIGSYHVCVLIRYYCTVVTLGDIVT